VGVYLVLVVESFMASGTHIVAKVVVQAVQPSWSHCFAR